VPRRHQRHQHQREAEGQVPALDELGQDGRQVDELREAEHHVEEEHVHDVLLPDHQHHHRHQMGGDGERGHHADPCAAIAKIRNPLPLQKKKEPTRRCMQYIL